jgi:hypothetical protein
MHSLGFPGPKLLLYGASSVTAAVERAYALDHPRVRHYTNYDTAVADRNQFRTEGVPAYVLTVGTAPHDLIQLKPERRFDQPMGRPIGDFAARRSPEDARSETLPAAVDLADIDVTWEELVRREPRLAALRALVEAVTMPGPDTDRPRQMWFSAASELGVLGLSEQLARSVGPWARSEDPLIISNLGYDVAYVTLYRLLPHEFAGGDEIG